MFNAGCIRKVEVKNFVTYTHVEMYPGPHLNMIIGPNGTGKSTMVAAIILGLGGTPKVVGRGTKISEYVKHNCNSAAINIYLQDRTENQYIKVTREFDTNDKTCWKLNNRKVKLDEVLKCIKQFNIQVNNLCQFLPQDRVQEFAKLNKQELLKQTQIALCQFDLIEKQETLITYKENHNEISGSLSRLEKKLEEARSLNLRLEGRVDNFNKKKEYQEKIDNIERKTLWMMYEELRTQLTDIKKDRSKAQEIHDKFKNTLIPMEKKINDIRKGITQKQQISTTTMQLIRNIKTAINTNMEKWEKLVNSIKKIEDDVETKLAEIEQWDKEIEDAANKLEEMKVLQKEIKAKYMASIEESGILSSELNKLLGLQKKLRDQGEEITQEQSESRNKVCSLEYELQRLENIRNNRLQQLEKISPDAVKAVNWLRNYKHLFESEIYEPVMLEVNVFESRFAKYVENVIPTRDRLAFTCVNKNDMNKLIRCLRENQNLSVNVVHSEVQSSNAFQPNIPIERLRKYGFFNYVNNLFTAPAPIVNYLCKTYQLHNIPVGDHTTNECFEQIPSQIRHFFSDKYNYRISFSKYSGQKSTRQIEVVSDGGLSLCLDVIRLNQLKGEIVEAQNTIQKCDSEYESLQQQISRCEEKVKLIRDRMKVIHQEKLHAQTIASRIQTTETKITEMKQMKKNPEVIESECREKIKNIVKNLHSVQEASRENMAKLISAREKYNLLAIKMGTDRNYLAYLENSVKDNQRLCNEAETNLNVIKDKHNVIMNQAKLMLSKAKSASNGFTPIDDGFKQFKDIYDSLPADVEELNNLKGQFQSRIACLNIAGDDEMEEYEKRQDLIKTLTEEIENANGQLNKLSSKIDRLRLEWLTPLKDLLSKINDRFATAFEMMGCAGEISIYTGDNDNNFSQYGICIKVTYRNGEPLQELNSHVQSGGERAVATAVYMLSLQELTPVPFRCVDEINQGMDENNERRIFELIVKYTCQDNSSQYFLITPKLVPHLKYSKNMAIHIVHNGPFVGQDKKWGFSEICNPNKIQIA